MPTEPRHHWDFVDEDGCLHCNCGVGVIEPQPGSVAIDRHARSPDVMDEWVNVKTGMTLCMVPKDLWELMQAAVGAGREYYEAWASDEQVIENSAREAFGKALWALEQHKST